MEYRGSRSWLASAAAAAVMVSALSGCSDDGGTDDGENQPSGEAQEDMQIIEGSWARTSAPQELVEVDAPDGLWEVIYQDDPGPAGNEDATTQVTISVPLENTVARSATNRFSTTATENFENFRPVSLEDAPQWERDQDEPDYATFHRTRYVYGPDQEYTSMIWALADQQRNAVLVQYAALDFDEDLAQQIEASLELTTE